MSAILSSRPPSPARGVVRGLRAGALAALCVLLPLLGHLLSQGHMPRWAVLLGMAAIAAPGAVLLTRHKLSDGQLMAALAGAQLAYHAAYALPGACAAVTGSQDPVTLVEHVSAAGVPPEVFLAGHLVMLVLAARLFGLTERLLWRGRPALEALRALLMFVWPHLHAGNGPKAALRDLETSAMPPSALVVRLHPGRAPPRCGRAPMWRAPLSTTGLSPGGGLCLS
ncbi:MULTISPECIES: hypothetical protein [unclassified Streptomyces]|uniref:hypothetical protein n=1 Tax=unclassified Streptomyces TaxID=2593676 RepID=UPI000DC76034|nr:MULTISPECIES: hypothetical protein [unclassified Streptomyces]AWZ05314.1 hypothetical protein DRB89_12300 [Streptomyces sp. ICC4]AWZ11438.1 hypothetical protein DRB96_02900 [Streptomyces sp. ICC1]